MRLIDADALIGNLQGSKVTTDSKDMDYKSMWQLLCTLVVETIEEEPTVLPSADRPKGEWIDEDGDKIKIDDNGITEGSCWCSVCGEWLVASDEYPTKGNFCPSCGADMRGKNDG